MSYTKTILCLANSVKYGGRCVAGREASVRGFGSWIRPVSDRAGEEVSEAERCYAGGAEPRVGDLITIPLARPVPHDYQQENHLIEPNTRWVRTGVVRWSALQLAVDDLEGPLWVNGSSSFNGVNDRVLEATARKMASSLYLVHPRQLKLIARDEGGNDRPVKRRTRASFSLGGVPYELAVTDPEIQAKYSTLGLVESAVSEALLTVSLGEPFNGYAYKLVAAVITADRVAL